MNDASGWTHRDTVAVLLIVPLAVAGLLVRRWSILLLWGWFVMPLGVVPISGSTALGLTAVSMVLIPSVHRSPKEEGDSLRRVLTAFLSGIFLSLLAAGLGWVALRFA